MKKGLPPKRRLFVHEYLVDLNATAAAKRAGYSKHTAKSQGQRLLTNADVKKAIDAARERRENKAIMTRNEVLEELTIIGRSDLKDYFTIDEGGEVRAKTFDEMPARASRALESIEEVRTIAESKDGKETSIVTDRRRFKLHSKPAALELLGKHLGLFPNKIEGDLTLRGKLSIEELKRSTKEAGDASAGE